MNQNSKSHSRRDFIKKLSVWTAITAGVLASISLLRQFVPRLTQYQRRFKIGRMNNFPVNTFTYVAERKLFVYRDHQGIRAVSAICTHLGCVIEKSDEGFQCPCHGSCYDNSGEVLSGPAPRDLAWFRVNKTSDGKVVIDPGETVAAHEKFLTS